MMKAAGPINGDVCRLLVQLDRRGHRTAAGQLAKLVETVKDGAVLTNIEPTRDTDIV